MVASDLVGDIPSLKGSGRQYSPEELVYNPITHQVDVFVNKDGDIHKCEPSAWESKQVSMSRTGLAALPYAPLKAFGCPEAEEYRRVQAPVSFPMVQARGSWSSTEILAVGLSFEGSS